MAALAGWPWTRKKTEPDSAPDGGAAHLSLASENLRELIGDKRLPAGVRESLAHDYAAVSKSSVDTLLRLIESGGRFDGRDETVFAARLVMRDSA